MEKCVFCDEFYMSPIDKAIDICPKCEKTEYELYESLDNKEMVMTYNDKTLKENQ